MKVSVNLAKSNISNIVTAVDDDGNPVSNKDVITIYYSLQNNSISRAITLDWPTTKTKIKTAIENDYQIIKSFINKKQSILNLYGNIYELSIKD
jgi:hypothetical protein|tara:strand:- start:680 stop:961 length:282 start_codon:yes stop_codon:yes gene_type:complete